MKSRMLFCLLVFGVIALIASACGAEPSAPVAAQPVAVEPTAALAETAVPTDTPSPKPILVPTDTSVPTAIAEPTATAAPAPAGRMETITIPAPSLAGNLIGDPAERKISIYLPPSYGTSETRYPVVYYLPGFGDSGMLGFGAGKELEKLIASGAVNEMIVVIADGINALDGSFYVNSPVTGNWEDFIAQDLVGYMDATYRTLPAAESRGISGHSMGGFGALNIAMHHPDVFSAVYSFSPGLFDANGLAESPMFGTQDMIPMFLRKQAKLADMPLEQAQKLMTLDGGNLGFSVAYGAAFAPNTGKQPPYIDYPYTQAADGTLVRDDEVWKRWESGFGGIAEEVQQYRDNLMSLRGLVVDCGTRDEYQWIPKGCAYYHQELTAAGIPHQFASHDGDHQSRLGQRIRDLMFPFFSQTLASE